MDYSRIYTQLVSRGRIRQVGLSKLELISKIGYVEQHHIVPKSMNGTDDASNLVYLTPEEHFLAHGLLVKIYPNQISLLQALMILSGDGKIYRHNKLYGWARRRYSEMRKGRPSPLKGRKRSMDVWNKGIPHSDEHKAKLSAKKKKRVSIDGIIYNSIAEAAVACGFDNYNRVTNRCNSDRYPAWVLLDKSKKRKDRVRPPKGPMSEETKEKMRNTKRQMKSENLSPILLTTI